MFYYREFKLSYLKNSNFTFSQNCNFSSIFATFRPTASSLKILWHGHVRDTLFHFCQWWTVNCVQEFEIVSHAHVLHVISIDFSLLKCKSMRISVYYTGSLVSDQFSLFQHVTVDVSLQSASFLVIVTLMAWSKVFSMCWYYSKTFFVDQSWIKLFSRSIYSYQLWSRISVTRLYISAGFKKNVIQLMNIDKTEIVVNI